MSLIRAAEDSDAEAIRDIYAEFCVPARHEGFENEVPSVDESRRRVAAVLKNFPWLVYEEGGKVLGFAHGATYQARPAFDWDVTVSVYVEPGSRRKSIGKKLHLELLSQLRALGYVNAYASIALPNEAAIALHESLGFSKIGVLPKVSYKGGTWHDLAFYSLALREHEATPLPPKKYESVLNASG